MILPTKHLHPDRALLAVGGRILGHLRQPMTVSGLWDEFRLASRSAEQAPPVSYDWFVLSLDLLFMVGAIEFERGLIRKVSP